MKVTTAAGIAGSSLTVLMLWQKKTRSPSQRVTRKKPKVLIRNR
ncbi:MAG: hypothetical protein GY754_36785 [bacterium]|nr:hypothetical protein [bacterium]